MSRVVLVAAPRDLSGGEHDRLAPGDDDRVLVVRRQRAVAGTDGPAVGGDVHLAAAGAEDRLDGEHHAGPSRARDRGSSKLGTCGASWMVRPIPWPVSSRMTVKPRRRTSASTAPPIARTRPPGRTAARPRAKAALVQSASRLARAVQLEDAAGDRVELGGGDARSHLPLHRVEREVDDPPHHPQRLELPVGLDGHLIPRPVVRAASAEMRTSSAS